MGYLVRSEHEARIAKVRELMTSKNLDIVLVYYDEFNIGNGWYLTGCVRSLRLARCWCS